MQLSKFQKFPKKKLWNTEREVLTKRTKKYILLINKKALLLCEYP